MSRYHGFPPRERDAIVAKLLARDGDACQICRAPLDQSITDHRHPALVTIDHIVGIAEDGDIGSSEIIENLQLAHRLCNHNRAKFPRYRAEWFGRELLRAREAWPKPSKRERKAARKTDG